MAERRACLRCMYPYGCGGSRRWATGPPPNSKRSCWLRRTHQQAELLRAQFRKNWRDLWRRSPTRGYEPKTILRCCAPSLGVHVYGMLNEDFETVCRDLGLPTKLFGWSDEARDAGMERDAA